MYKSFYYIWKTNYKSCQIMYKFNIIICIRTVKYPYFISSLCTVAYVTLDLLLFEGFLWLPLWMQWGITFSSALYRVRKKRLVCVVFSFKSEKYKIMCGIVTCHNLHVTWVNVQIAFKGSKLLWHVTCHQPSPRFLYFDGRFCKLPTIL